MSELIPAWLDVRRSLVFDEWRKRGPTDRFWTETIYGKAMSPAESLAVPALHRGAWWDPFRRGQVHDSQTAARTSSHEQRLVVDATDHYDHPWSPDDGPVVEWMAGLDTFTPYLLRYLDEALEFFDQHLRDGGNRREPADPVRIHLANGPWRTTSHWPPPEAHELELHLTGDALAEKPDRHSSQLAWVHDPDDLVPSAREYWAAALDIPNESALAARDDVLTFDSEEMRASLDLTGPASVAASLGTDATFVTLVAQLMDVFPDGRSLRITEGARRARAAADGAVAFSVDLGPLGYRVEPGHRLRLHLSSSSFPRYMPDPGFEVDPWMTDRWRPARQRLFVGGQFGSRLRLSRWG